MTKQVAFLGLGLMGGSMAANLARHGFEVKAWNRTRDRAKVKIAADAGVTIVDSIQVAVKDAEIILTCVSDISDVEEVTLGEAGIINYAKANALIVDMSTIGSLAAKEIGKKLQQQNLRFIDAPVSGGDIGAQNGTLTIMVGGKRSDFQECLPLFEAMGKNITLCGDIGSGQGVKMCNQVLASLTMVGICEAMQLAEHQGIDPNLVVEVCGTGAAGSWALSNLGDKIIEEDYAPGFAIKHMLKDLRLVQSINETSGDNLPGTELADRLFKTVRAMNDGQGKEQGTQAMIRAYLADS